LLQKVAAGPGDEYRSDFDLYSSAPEGDVQWLLGLGATVRGPARPGRDFLTLNVPDGNPFDVVDACHFAFRKCTD
jgi:hypothetical protein